MPSIGAWRVSIGLLVVSACGASPETLQTTWTWLGVGGAVLGAIFAALGGGLSYHYGKAVQKNGEIEAARKEALAEKKIDDLMASSTRQEEKQAITLQRLERLEPLETLAKDRYPNLAIDDAVARLRDEIEGLKGDVAKERTARQMIESRMAGRTLDETQEKALIAALSAHKGTYVLARLGEQEANEYGTKLLKVLEKAGWRAVRINDIGLMSPPPYGVRYGADASPAGKAFASAMASLPDAQAALDPSPEANVTVIVGLKPPN